jgi:hypothetical protein
VFLDLRDHFWKIDGTMLYASDLPWGIASNNLGRVTPFTIDRDGQAPYVPLIYRGDEYTLVICAFGAFWQQRPVPRGIVLSNKRECE